MAASLTAAGLAKNPCFLRRQILKSPFYPPLSYVRGPRIVFIRRVFFSYAIKASKAPETKATGSSPGLYSAQTFELTAQNVDLVLEDVRPYLISDGGNVDVVSVEDGVISLKLQGACGNCPSSTTTMKMGIERVLKEKFGDAIKDIRQVFDDQPSGE
uniref:NIF system FeS cluster assembly NifU C-terminal domain-containing protein n=1 Tax=Nelumbo nucifera TaxID=4432 RepID=A0A822Z5T3_NELNU|nr:TPA_asm: hypothetical protein HUJ06_008997 [Nelumbo nucifera]